MPKKADISIQKTEPAPPSEIAVATPIMLPMPIVPARAVARDLKGEILLFGDLDCSSFDRSFIINGNFLTCRNDVLKVKYAPHPRNTVSIMGPQRKELTISQKVRIKLFKKIPPINDIQKEKKI